LYCRHLSTKSLYQGRKHCVIERGLEGYFIKNLSQANPLYYRNKRVEKKRFFSGDQFTIGPYALTFLSDKSEDQPPKSKGTHVSIWIAGACLLIALASVILYYQVYGPWKADKILKEASAYVNEGSYIEAHEILTKLLDTNPPKKEFEKARELLTLVTLSQAQALVAEDKLSEAKRSLITFLSKYGLYEGASDAWDLLDQCRIRLGHQLEDAREYTEALKEFSAIKADSPYYDETQRTISRLWLTNQQSYFQRQTVSQLLEAAEEHFQAKRYLTPVNKNAYAAYQAVLSFEPENTDAKMRIEEIKDFFRLKGEEHFQNLNYAKAISFFAKYTLIDPQDISIKEKVVICNQKLAENSDTGEEEEARREKVKNLLEESGSGSSWVMEYLYEEEDQQSNSEKPW
jgi:tetratricopeptide (TPR) repeat protein